MDKMQELTIKLPDLSEDDVFADHVVGREALNEAFQFDVDVISSDVLDIEKMLGKATTLKIKVLDETCTVHGIVMAAASLDPTTNREFCYRIEVAPSMALMKLSSQNQVYGTDEDMSVIDIVENELKDGAKGSSKTGGSRSPRKIDYKMQASGNFPKLDFVMQYRESDFDFISRLCEKFGIFYMFDHDGDRDIIVFNDRNAHFRQLSGQDLSQELSFRHASMTSGDGDFAIRSFNGVHRAQAGKVELREYNDETPSVDLNVAAAASFTSHGLAVRYGENYKTTSEGDALAKTRIERLAVDRLMYHGESNIPLLRPGFFFKLVDHPDSDFEQLYVVTEVEHRMTESTPLGFTGADKTAEPYSNRFVCIPFETAYRPALKTPKPVVDGVVIAFIDGDEDAAQPQLDEYGRYRVRILEEESGLSDGKASHFVRKAEPFGGGDGYGAHSTLLVGTEVLLAFIGGDPDRPVVVGALSNAEQTNPVIDHNANVAHRTKTGAGIIFELSDGTP